MTRSTGSAPDHTGNPAPRVSRCLQCDARFEASARGPLPRRCPPCRRPRLTLHRIGSARNAARAARAPAAIRQLLDAAYAAASDWSSHATRRRSSP